MGPGHTGETAPTEGSPDGSVHSCLRVNTVLARLGDRWSMVVFMRLLGGPRRFNELRRAVPGISRQMLTRALRALERDGVVSRTVLPTSPPQVEYATTPLGQALAGHLRSIGAWALDNLPHIEQAQRRFDAQRGGEEG